MGGKNKSVLIGVQEAVRNNQMLIAAMTGDEARKALAPAGAYFLYGARRRAPFDPKREKGIHLRDALFMSTQPPPGKTKVVDILVGADHRRAPHAHLMELGWEKHPEGYPFLRVTAVEDEQGIRELVAQGMQRVVEERIMKFKRVGDGIAVNTGNVGSRVPLYFPEE